MTIIPEICTDGWDHDSSLEHRLGAKAVEGKTTVHDLHATTLHLLGLDHEKLSYRYSGRDFRITDSKGSVVKETIV